MPTGREIASGPILSKLSSSLLLGPANLQAVHAISSLTPNELPTDSTVIPRAAMRWRASIGTRVKPQLVPVRPYRRRAQCIHTLDGGSTENNLRTSPVALYEEAIPGLPNHFSVDGTLIEAVASIKSCRRRDEEEPPSDDDPGNL